LLTNRPITRDGAAKKANEIETETVKPVTYCYWQLQKFVSRSRRSSGSAIYIYIQRAFGLQDTYYIVSESDLW